MDGRGLMIARVGGVAVRVRWGALVLFAVIAWLLADRMLPAAAPSLAVGWRWAAALGGAVLFDAGLVVHELGHAVLARRYGLKADSAELVLFGGVTEIEGEVRTPGQQWRMAAVGPAVHLGYAAAAALVTLVAASTGAPAAAVAVGTYVAAASAAVGLLNLLPGAPLDGGRILQAWRWHRHGDAHRAALDTTRAGVVLGALLIAVGAALAATHLLTPIGGSSVAAMGLVALFGARAERRELAGPPG